MTRFLDSRQQPGDASHPARPRVFITDPSIVVVDRLVELLADIAQVVGRATTARETLAGIRRAYPQLAVFDITMAHGAELLVDLKQRASGLVVAILTHSADDTTRNKCLQLGADYFLDKLYDTDRLRDIVGVLGDHSSGRTPPSLH